MSGINQKKRRFSALDDTIPENYKNQEELLNSVNKIQMHQFKARSESEQIHFANFEKSLASVSETMKQSVTILNSVGESLLKKLKTLSKPEEKEKMFASLNGLYDHDKPEEKNLNAAIMNITLGSLEGESDMFSDMFDIVSTLGTAETFSHI